MTVASLEVACREYAQNYGAEYPRSQWLLTPWDTWERNPHYVGLDQPHPEGCGHDGA